MRRAVFLDRDGVINREVDVLRSVKQLRLLPRVAEAIQRLNEAGFLVVIVTNQPVVARGWLTEKEVDGIHEILLRRLQGKGARVDAVYYCPHHPNANLKRYRRKCSCRKPNPGLFIKAAKKFKIGLKKSFSVGDMMWDILAGKRAGTTTILVETGYGGKDKKLAIEVSPDYTAKNLYEAVRIIKRYAK
ncbi:HAD family hydrolase [Candidatus Parcubacteria bacterium]|nr:MAG: HAD family hydrolase [Candidatus Parcubacteria bacterium]